MPKVKQPKPELSIHNLYLLEKITAFHQQLYSAAADGGKENKSLYLKASYPFGLEITLTVDETKLPEDGVYYPVKED